MFRENARKLGIFGYEYLIFFLPKVFSSRDQPFERKKNRKKRPFQKVAGSSWIHPYKGCPTITDDKLVMIFFILFLDVEA
jgi:hypothetical protein